MFQPPRAILLQSLSHRAHPPPPLNEVSSWSSAAEDWLPLALGYATQVWRATSSLSSSSAACVSPNERRLLKPSMLHI